MPILSVILPVYNCEKYVFFSIDSILKQTFSDFELIIIDDCSTDRTVLIISEIKDKRIKLIRKKENFGIANCLNYGISIANGIYIARMDADDICLPQRFEKQISFLTNNPNILFCGTAIQIIDSDIVLRHPMKHDEIKIKLFFGNSFYHPTIMGRKETFLVNPYNSEFESAEDYDLWTRLVLKGELANIDEVLLLYRVHDKQVSFVKSQLQKQVVLIIKKRMVTRMKVDSYHEGMINVMSFIKPENVKQCKAIVSFCNELILNNKILKEFNQELFTKKINNIRNSLLQSYFKNHTFFCKESIFFFLKNFTAKDFFYFLKLNEKARKMLGFIKGN